MRRVPASIIAFRSAFGRSNHETRRHRGDLRVGPRDAQTGAVITGQATVVATLRGGKSDTFVDSPDPIMVGESLGTYAQLQVLALARHQPLSSPYRLTAATRLRSSFRRICKNSPRAYPQGDALIPLPDPRARTCLDDRRPQQSFEDGARSRRWGDGGRAD